MLIDCTDSEAGLHLSCLQITEDRFYHVEAKIYN